MKSTTEEWEKEFDRQFPKFDDLQISLMPDFTIEDKAKRQTQLLSIQQHNTKLGYIKDFIRETIDRISASVREETAKAFGGCINCYGKGYATHMQQLIGAEDFGGDGFQEKPRVHITYCTCDRGKQLKSLSALQKLSEEGELPLAD